MRTVNRLSAVGIIVCALLVLALAGCVRLAPALVGEPTPGPTPTPTLPPAPIALTPAPVETDASGAPIAGEGHYDRYVAFERVRVYEYEMGTMLDGVCVNDYPKPLAGQAEIEFFDKTGEKIAAAMLYTAGETERLCLQPGKNLVYAEIGTDIDVQMMDFTLTVTQAFMPLQ